MTCKCIIFHNLQKLFTPYHIHTSPHLKPSTQNNPLSLINTNKNEFSYNKITLTKHTTKKHKHQLNIPLATPSTPTPSTRTRSRVHLPSIYTKKIIHPQFPLSLINKGFTLHKHTHILKYSFYIYQ